ncbi:MAG TPA: hypothetical protein VJ161_03445, partial [Geobacteraceae bacterium]|nr:hypothetical protein [Geobacteraceae bacterium]
DRLGHRRTITEAARAMGLGASRCASQPVVPRNFRSDPEPFTGEENLRTNMRPITRGPGLARTLDCSAPRADPALRPD